MRCRQYITVVLLSFFVFAINVSAVSPVEVTVNPASQVIKKGQEITINISIDPVNSPITAAQFNMLFNSSLIEVKNVTEGDLYSQNGADTIFNSGILNNTEGTLINVWGLIITPGANVTTKGDLATITIYAKDAGVSLINLTSVIVSDPDSQAAQVNITNGSITASLPPHEYIPPIPVNLTSTHENFWVNHTWEAGADNITDSYNVSVNGTWYNGTANTFRNTTTSPHGWVNISVWAYNSSAAGSLSPGSVSRNTRIPNNPPIQNTIGNKSVNGGQLLTFTVSATDADNDVITYGTNATKGTFNTATGEFSWTSGYGDAGVYVWYFNSSDSYGGVASETIAVTVNNVPLSITNSLPASDPATTAGTAQTFAVYLNRTANVTWYINGSAVQTNSSGISASYTNSTANIGMHNVTATASDAYDSISRTWNWTVTAQPAYNVSGYVFDNYGSGLGGVLVQNNSNQNTTIISGHYSITGLLNGTYNFSYSKAGFNNGYLIVTVSGAGNTSANIKIYDTTPPAQVTGLINDTPAQTTVNLTWNSTADANYYQVFRNFTSIGYTRNTYWNDTGLTQDTLYEYMVRSNDSYNNRGQNSSVWIVTARPDTTPPDNYLIYIPWTATTQGWTTPYVIANKGSSNASINISYYNQADGSYVGSYSANIIPGASKSIFREWTTSKTDGSAVLVSDQPVTVVVDQFNNGQNKFGAYEVGPSGSSEVFLPWTAATGGWTTPYVIVNRGTANATVSITYYNLDGSTAGNYSVNILPGASKFVFREWSTISDGAARLSSTQPISVLVDMFKNSENKFEAYTPASIADRRVFIPWTATTQGWTTPIKIVNRGVGSAVVNISYYNQMNGQLAGNHSVSIAPNEVVTVLRESTTANGTDGSAVLNSTQLISVIVEQFNNKEGKFGVYTPAMTASNTIVIPWTATTQGWTTPYVIVNRGSTAANVNISYYNQADGSRAGNYSVSILPGASKFVFREWTTSNTDGSAVVVSDQPIAVMVDQFKNGQNKFGAYTPVG